MSSPYEHSDDLPVYVISVAAQLSGMHPQTLRAYDRLGLVSPGRSAGRGYQTGNSIRRAGSSPSCTPRSRSCASSSSPPAPWRRGWPSCAAAALTADPGSCRCAAPGSRYGNR
jgi:hypothetical protein